MKTSLKLVLAFAIIAITSATSHAQTLINVDFKLTGNPATSGAALLGTAGDTWNNLYDGADQTGLALVDSSGTSITPTLSYDGFQYTYFATPVAGSGAVPSLTSDMFGLNTFVDPNGKITISGLTVGDSFTWIIYANADGANRATDFTVDSVTLSTDNTTDYTALVSGVNYVQFTGVVGASGTLTADITAGAGSGVFHDVSGFQLQVVPEPATVGLLVGGLLACVVMKRRRSI